MSLSRLAQSRILNNGRGVVASFSPMQRIQRSMTDWSKRAAPAIMNGTAVVGINYRGPVLSLEGTTSYARVSSPSAPSSLDEMSVSCWVQPTSAAGGTVIDCATAFRNYGMSISATKLVPQYAAGANGTPSNTSLKTNVPHHVCVVRTGSTGSWAYKVYINGFLDNTQNTSINPSKGSYNLNIGVSGVTGSSFFTGNIWNVKVRNYPMCDGEVFSEFSRRRQPVLNFLMKRTANLFRPWFMLANQ